MVQNRWQQRNSKCFHLYCVIFISKSSVKVVSFLFSLVGAQMSSKDWKACTANEQPILHGTSLLPQVPPPFPPPPPLPNKPPAPLKRLSITYLQTQHLTQLFQICFHFNFTSFITKPPQIVLSTSFNWQIVLKRTGFLKNLQFVNLLFQG